MKRAAVWAAGDQAAVSVTNFLVALLVARRGDAAELGLFVIAFAVLLAGTTLQRALLTDPFTVLDGRTARRPALGRLALAAGAAYVALGIAAATVAVLAPGRGAGIAVGVALALVPFLAQDALRSVLLVVSGPRAQAVNDGLTGAVQVVAVLALPAGAAFGIAALGIGCAAGALAAAVGLRGAVRLRGRPQLAPAELWSLGRSLGADAAAYTLAGQLLPLAAAAVAGPAALGALRAATTFFAPLQAVVVGLNRGWLAELARVDDATRRKQLLDARRRRLLLAGGAWALAGAVVAPFVVGGAFGAELRPSPALIAVLGVWTVAQTAYSLAAVETKIRHDGRMLVRSRVASGIASAAVLPLAAYLDQLGIALALATGQTAGALLLGARPRSSAGAAGPAWPEPGVAR